MKAKNTLPPPNEAVPLAAILERLLAGKNLNREESESAMLQILEGEGEPWSIKTAAFVSLLSSKKEDPEEIAGLLDGLMARADIVDVSDLGNVIDTAGTGGDKLHTLNVSTLAALTVAAAGGKVLKHGNRSVSSKFGSADMLEFFGVKIRISPQGVRNCLNETGIGFCFAPDFHPAFGKIAKVRKELAFPGIFNVLGPLANPGGVKRQIIGVSNPNLSETMAQVLQKRGAEHAMIVCGEAGGETMDELSIFGTSQIVELKNGSILKYEITPEELGLKPADMAEIQIESENELSAIPEKVFSGESSASQEIVALNAAAALVVAELADDIKSALELARETLKNKAQDTLDRFREVSQKQETHERAL